MLHSLGRWELACMNPRPTVIPYPRRRPVGVVYSRKDVALRDDLRMVPSVLSTDRGLEL